MQPWLGSLVKMSQYSKVAGLIPGQGTLKNQPMHAIISGKINQCYSSLSFSLPSPLSLNTNLKKWCRQGDGILGVGWVWRGQPFLTLHSPMLTWSGHQGSRTRQPESYKVSALTSWPLPRWHLGLNPGDLQGVDVEWDAAALRTPAIWSSRM